VINRIAPFLNVKREMQPATLPGGPVRMAVALGDPEAGL
jgi:hypothetical protein